MAESTSGFIPAWQTLPPTPTLPPALISQATPLNKINLWYGIYGQPLSNLSSSNPKSAIPILLLHGGHISSRWFAHLIRFLSPSYTLIAIDTRGHGRSTDDLSTPLSYALFASDAMALLDHLHIPKVSIIGWSDGANTGLEIAMRHSSRLDRLFAFGANARPDQGNVEGVKGMVFARELSERIQREFGEISPPPGGYQVLRDRIREMQGREPMWGMEDFARIPVLGRDDGAPLVWLASAEREELVLPKTTWEIRDSIPNSSLIMLPGVSHFGPLQDPETFAAVVKRFLEVKKP